MPAFTFEKIPAPANQTSAGRSGDNSETHTVSKSRGLIFSMLDRIAIARLKREQAAIASAAARKSPVDANRRGS